MSDRPLCCPPSRPAGSGSPPAIAVSAPATNGQGGETVAIPGGSFRMGEGGPMAYPGDGETPVDASVAGFSIETTAVTNDRFAAFVEATGHVTDAGRFGWSFVFGGLLPDDFPPTRAVAAAPWWRQVEGADWRYPEGPGSDLDGRGDHPVVHVSWNDAMTYAAWCQRRLPSEAEWEFAARAGSAETFPWGTELEPGGAHRMNVFQGRFPNHNTAADGWAGTCPVNAFEANAYGLENMLGNVWEWTDDWFDADRRNPSTGVARLLKGGSYLCHASYCRRYRPAARMGSTPDSSAGNVGFRCAAVSATTAFG